MDIVEPRVNDAPIIHLQNIVHEISSLSCTVLRKRECRKYIMFIVLSDHICQESALLIAYVSKKMIIRSISGACFVVEDGYARVSTKDQNLDRQLMLFRGICKVFTAIVSLLGLVAGAISLEIASVNTVKRLGFTVQPISYGKGEVMICNYGRFDDAGK